jgi:hypoxia up-regulated 1
LYLYSLAAINNVEAEISARAEARNLLEGYLYRLTGLLGDDPSSDALQKFSTAEEQKFLSTGAQAAFEWMAEEADTADLKTLKGKRSHLE